MSYELMFQKAVELQQNGALNEAEQIYRQILQTAPDNADVLNMLGLIAQSRGLHKDACGYFYQAINAAPQHFPIFFNLAVSLSAAGNWAEAREAYEKVLSLNPQCKEAFWALGNLCWQQNDLSAAAEMYRQALAIDGGYIEAQTNLAEVTDDIESLKKIAGNNPSALYYLGRRAFNQQNFAEALPFLQQADFLYEDDNLKVLLGETLQHVGRSDEARKMFYQAYRLNERNFQAVLNIADCESSVNNVADAEKFYHKAIAIDAHNVQVHLNFANLLLNNKRPLEALEEYRSAAILAPDTPEICYNLALILKNLQEYEQALDLLFQAYYSAPQYEEWRFAIAETLVLFYAKAPEKARKICENWLAKMPEDIVVQHLWAALNQQTVPQESEYNRLLFNAFAETYEETLHNINYAVLDAIAEKYSPLNGEILDLGCGTGLAAAKLKSEHNTFYGVDISEQMLAKAKSKNIYKELYCQDIVTFLENNTAGFDYVVAADVFCYFGDLQPIVQNCRHVPLIFSLEKIETTQDYVLQANGRYKHSASYVLRLLADCGYHNVEKQEIDLRQEGDGIVKGYLFLAKP